MNDVYILDGARTAFTSFGGSFTKVGPTELGIATAKEAMKRSGVSPSEIEQVIYGNVIHSSGNAPYVARHIATQSEVPVEVPAMLVNRLCGSGLQSVVSGAQSIMLNEGEVALVGGVDNMSMSPHVSFSNRFGHPKLGGVEFQDMLLLTLRDEAIGNGMGITAENLADQYGITREEQDEFSKLSHERASKAIESGRFKREIVPVEVKERKGTKRIDTDEHVRPSTTVEGLSNLKPTFKKDGSVTAGNSSGINDGAASLIVAAESFVAKRSLKPIAKIKSWGICGVDPTVMGIGPVPAIQMALSRAGLTTGDIDLFEINEAFAAQYLSVEKELKLDRNKTNVNGGAVALGHPVGASGSRLLLSLAYELQEQDKQFGVASLCIGGGQGIAMVIERVN
ncbi:thiolase family protein [Pseudalkalibacillus berkeleyi]|uniref:acetyl-CoA C-acetyltransferase n=1 Tax=Pseudalkalibacillus berkeleyi TaxID=1069813 RepID=A0ABS9H202_9BACL|nr:thiolase family protein [Pseudalkalibacillus berkeleyi]MCF6137665.1 thiolase family protein [Pseudalkalibacillus berkeleyi]